MAGSPADPARQAGRELGRMKAVAAAAAAVQHAADEHEVFEAVGVAMELQGVSSHLAALEATGAFLVIRKTVLPWAHQAQLERIHGGPVVGARIPAGPGTAHATVVNERRSMHAPAPLAWVIDAAPEIGPAEADAIGEFVGLGEALLVPITDGREVFGVLTLWAPALGGADRATAEILGRLAGGALSAQRARDAAWPERAPSFAA